MSIDLKDPEKLLKQILSRRSLRTIRPGTLTVSCYANFYPVCYKSKNKLVGLDVDILRFFCKVTGLRLKLIERKKFDQIWFDPIKKKSDISIGGIGVTDERTVPGMMWSIPYFYVHRTLIYNRKYPILNFPRDVSGIIRATPGSTGWIDGKYKLEKNGKQKWLESGYSDEQDMDDLKQGKIQGLLRGSFVGRAIVKREKSLAMLKPWSIDSKLVSSDGEVFAYPTLCESGVGQMISVFLTEEIFTGELAHLVKKYKLE